MIRRAEEFNQTVMDPMFGGDGKVTLQHYWSKEEMLSANRLCAKLVIEPGCSSGFHIHEGEEEIFIILKGKAQVDDNGTLKELNVGDSMLTICGEGHAIKNIGDDTLEVLALISCY